MKEIILKLLKRVLVVIVLQTVVGAGVYAAANKEKLEGYMAVEQSGVYRVTHVQLLSHGIDLQKKSIDKIAVTFRGKGVARYIGGASTKGKTPKWTSESWIEFEGVAPEGEDALYLEAYRYELRSGSEQLAVAVPPIPPKAQKRAVFETNAVYSNTVPLDDPFYDAFVSTVQVDQPGVLTRHFQLPTAPVGETVSLTVGLAGYSFTEHRVTIELNGVQVADVNATRWTVWPVTFTVPVGYLDTGDNTLTLRAYTAEEGKADVIIYDKLTVAYEDGSPIAPMTPGIEAATDPVFRSALLPPAGTNLLIISHPRFINATLQRYVDERSAQGWHIYVADVEQIDEAYDSKMATPRAIQRYLEDAVAQGVSHVQLVGSAMYDYHNYLGTGAESFIPSIYVLTEGNVKYTPCDGCYALDTRRVPILAIGRWPVRTTAELETIVNKSLAWEANQRHLTHSALLVADRTQGGLNFSAKMEAIAAQLSAAGWSSFYRVYMDNLIALANGDNIAAAAAAEKDILQALSEDVSLSVYEGHATQTAWSQPQIFTADDIRRVSNLGRPVVVLGMSCFTTYVDTPSTMTLPYQWLFGGENGAVAVVGSSILSSYGENNVLFDFLIGNMLGNMLVGQDLGSALRNAKQSMRDNWMDIIFSANLLGDVTLTVQ